MQELSEEAVADAADVFDEYVEAIDEDANRKQTVELMNRLGDVADTHEIPEGNRINFIIGGLERFFDRRKAQAVSDFREQLEAFQL